MSGILDLLALDPSPESVDYVTHKGQFHLHSLLTEQRHARTWELGFTVQADPRAALEAILAVDEDLSARIAGLGRDPAPLEKAVAAVVEAVREGRRIYVYGCGATGRLAKQMESTFWRPFWRALRRSPTWEQLAGRLPDGVEELLVGEMTGGDRALVSSLEGFEDLMLVGQLQLEDHGIERGDVVICVTEGGETSSVIGTVLAALAAYGELDEARCAEARERLFFVYNNPDELLRPFERSARVLDSPGITRLNLATGPQAIAGSTRMQATTIETFVLGAVLEEAVARLLRPHLSTEELGALGLAGEAGLSERLASFDAVRAAAGAAVEELAGFTALEAEVYAGARFATYAARSAMITVFIDCTERSPTFRLYPLDRVQDPERRCWVQVWTDGQDAGTAWRAFLGRRFRGLSEAFYRRPLADGVDDPYLRGAALSSLANAGDEQERCYDFSLSAANVARSGPAAGDLGVLVLVDDELEELAQEGSLFHRFRQLFEARGARLALVHVSSGEGAPPALHGLAECVVPVRLPGGEDPLGLRRQIALKMLLNAHSSAVMARLGRVIGNTMTNVSPSNLKLIGRATFLVLSHVNDVLSQPGWIAEHGAREPLSFAEANAVLMDAIRWVGEQGSGQTAEVALSIIRIVESWRCAAAASWERAREILAERGLAAFLLEHNPALRGG